MTSRADIEKFIIDNITRLTPGNSDNAQLYRELFSKMSDEAFDAYLDKLESGENTLSIISPNFSEAKITVENNLALAKELGHEFFERLWIKDGNDSPMYLSNDKYMVVMLPFGRQAQVLDKKIAVPEHNNSVDDLTGQPTGDSKGAKISFPELQILSAAGLEQSAIELIKLRGGDETAFRAMNSMIGRTGGASLEDILKLNTTVKANQALHVILVGMHIDTTLLKK
jgi:hypothetical protein